jgi:aminopeptidase N
MTLQALRNTVGDEDFWAIVRQWIETNAHATGTTAELETIAEQISGQELSDFFDAWLFAPTRPPRSALGESVPSVRPAVADRAAAWIRGMEQRHPG